MYVLPKPGTAPVVQAPCRKKRALVRRSEHGKPAASAKPEPPISMASKKAEQSKGRRGKNAAKTSQDAEQADVHMEDRTKEMLAQGDNNGSGLPEVPVTNMKNNNLPGQSAGAECEHASIKRSQYLLNNLTQTSD